MATTETEKNGTYRAYCVPITDREDLRDLIVHLPGFMNTAEANNKKMIVEVWYESVGQAEALLRNWQNS